MQTGKNNRKNAWNARNKPIVIEVLWEVMKTNKRVENAIEIVQENVKLSKPPTIDGLARNLTRIKKPINASETWDLQRVEATTMLTEGIRDRRIHKRIESREKINKRK